MRGLFIISMLLFSPLYSISNSEELTYLEGTLENLRRERDEVQSSHKGYTRDGPIENKRKFTGGSWKVVEFSPGFWQQRSEDLKAARIAVLQHKIAGVKAQIRRLSASPNCHY